MIVSGSVLHAYGDGVFTSDSWVSTAAVFLGYVAVGEMAEVRIVCGGAQTSFSGGSANGVTTLNWGPYPMSFTLSLVGPVAFPNDQCTQACLYAFCGDTSARARVRVRGVPWGNAWGTGTYAADSAVGVAAMHAGLVGEGEYAEVEAVCGGPTTYTGSVRHGLTTLSYGLFGPSFTLVASPAPSNPPTCVKRCLAMLCSFVGKVLHVTVTGEANVGTPWNSVWGGASNGIYTDDSWLPVAAVHAGLVTHGQTARIVAICRGPQDAFAGSQVGDTVTLPYGPWSRSVSLHAYQA